MAILGIDFGRTTCRMAIYGERGPRLVRDERGNEVIDACFGIAPKTHEPVVGERVKSIFQSHPDMAVEQIRRRMGEDVHIPLGSEEVESQAFTPEEIAAHIFRHLKRSAEAQLKEPVDRSVITVPANFPDPARRATKKAGEIAGMTVERIINEPTAAALAHNHDATLERGHAMVYNLGKATFDVSIVKCMDDVFDIQASSGDTELGGKDFDEALLWHVAEKFEEEHGLSVEPKSDNYYRLLFECENAKKELSFNRRTTVNIPFFKVKDGDPVDLAVEVSRPTFEDLIDPLVAETTGAVERVLTGAGISRTDLDHVILTGGNTHIPYVQSFVRHVVGRRPLSQVDPEKAVVLGAAVQAGIIDGDSDNIIMDVCPLSFGVAAEDTPEGAVGWYHEIIPPNSKVLREHTFTKETEYRDQESIELKLYQRESTSGSLQAEIDGQPDVEEGFTFLEQLEVDMPRGPAGQEVELTFIYNPDGVLDVTAEILQTGEEITFEAHTGLVEGQIEESKGNLDEAWKESVYFEDVKALLQAAEDELESGLAPEKEEELQSLIDDLKEALAGNEEEQVRRLEEKITDDLFDLV
jgi:molecular chaperone DnaK